MLVTFMPPIEACMKARAAIGTIHMTSTRILVFLLIVANAVSNSYYRMPRKYPCSNTRMTDTLRDVFLIYHNDARRRVARGIERDKYGYLNPAKNMYKLEWDCTMEQQAQYAIVSCPKDLRPWSNMAQNLIRWYSSIGFFNPAEKIQSSLNNWWGEAKEYGVSRDNRFTSTELYAFANMVFSETTKIGCAYQVCRNYMTVTCLYNAVAYFKNERMWQTGRACRSASECTTHANSVCDAGLCTKIAAAPETNNECWFNSGMTDSVRRTFLSYHNYFRSRVARGLEADALGVGGHAPKASRMLKMVYNCRVEASAMRHARKCGFRHSSATEREDLGENLYMTTALYLDKNRAAARASQRWWSELAQYGVGQANNLTRALWDRNNTQIGHYTQMAWESSYKLGCAVQHCTNMTLVVCQYGPPYVTGNYLNRFIYTVGKPCTSNAGCPGAYTCSVAEGLCNVIEVL